MLREEWNDIIGFDGFYQASNLGQIRSCNRTVTYVDGRKRFCGGQVLKPYLNPRGYLAVCLHKDQKNKVCTVHELVMLAFIGVRPKAFDINHIDGVKTNNYLSNLEYCSKSDNVRHSFAMGLQVNPRGEKHNRAKLSEYQILEIRRLYAAGEVNQVQIASIYDVTKNNINSIVNRKTWRHL
jgi:hypothetical protein